MRLADRMRDIGTETAFEAAARARALEAEGRDIIHLEIGEPDFDTPAHVREAAKRALDAGETHYAPFAGIPALREAIAEDAATRKGFAVDPSQVFVTVVGATPVAIPIRQAHDFRLDVEELASLVTPRTRMLILNSPANPTGGV